MNLYGYVGGNPLNAVDPMGLAPGGLSTLKWWGIRTVAGTLLGVPLTVGQGIGIFNPSGDDPDVVWCTLMFSNVNGDQKDCFYKCPSSGTNGGFRVISIDKCDDCKEAALFDNINYGAPLFY